MLRARDVGHSGGQGRLHLIIAFCSTTAAGGGSRRRRALFPSAETPRSFTEVVAAMGAGLFQLRPSFLGASSCLVDRPGSLGLLARARARQPPPSVPQITCRSTMAMTMGGVWA